MRIPGTNAHLTYCLNVHPGGTLAEAEAAIFEHAPRVFAEFAHLTGVQGPYGLGIWLPAAAARELTPPKPDALARRLEEAGLYALTFNGFPYGRFHGVRVKEKVYQPDWADGARYQYTAALADILVRLAPSAVRGTISTLPVTFRPWADAAKLATATENLVEAAGYLDVLRDTTGREAALALEPEPGCCLERTDDVLRLFGERLLPVARTTLPGDGEAVLRRHVGVCLDTVHAAVMGEDPKEALRKYAAAGIRVAKVQLGAALRVQVGPEGPPPALRAFQDDVYLHQTVVKTSGGQELYFNDLPEPLAMKPPPQGEWRVHFHVPLSWPGEGQIATCHGVDEDFLAAAPAAGCEHFESEIYTLDVFPAAKDSKESILAQDLAWLWQRFRAVRP
jgi:sugar phosphate isomerase/epimerase